MSFDGQLPSSDGLWTGSVSVAAVAGLSSFCGTFNGVSGLTKVAWPV